MRFWKLVLAATIGALAACTYRFDAFSGNPAQAAAPRVVQFIAFGDAGTGSERQLAAGRAMARVCAERGCDFALELGDNFYPAGVRGVEDPQFQSAFEKPYALFNMPVYAVLGNHDNGTQGGEGNNNARGDIQLAYRSPKWKMPARYYRFAAPAEAAEPFAEFFALDSSPLAAYAADPDPQWSPASYGARQLAWLQQSLRGSRARWRIAFAHHPYISNGLHGNAGNYDADRAAQAVTARGQPWKDLLDQTVCAGGADLYLSAHDHDLEWLKPAAACGNTQFIISGAAAPDKVRKFGDAHRNAAYWQADQTAGFFWIRLEDRRMTVAAFTLTAQDELRVDARGRPLAAYEQSVQHLPEAPRP